ncbi:hypothetical protein GWE18_10055 [Bradyrhizobium sp. CSA112]|nr:hypothetical protein [Bradyrhizobium sp. CSA112]
MVLSLPMFFMQCCWGTVEQAAMSFVKWAMGFSLRVIACDKREAFVQGSDGDEAIHSYRAGRWIAALALAMTVSRRAC